MRWQRVNSEILGAWYGPRQEASIRVLAEWFETTRAVQVQSADDRGCRDLFTNQLIHLLQHSPDASKQHSRKEMAILLHIGAQAAVSIKHHHSLQLSDTALRYMCKDGEEEGGGAMNSHAPEAETVLIAAVPEIWQDAISGLFFSDLLRVRAQAYAHSDSQLELARRDLTAAKLLLELIGKDGPPDKPPGLIGFLLSDPEITVRQVTKGIPLRLIDLQHLSVLKERVVVTLRLSNLLRLVQPEESKRLLHMVIEDWNFVVVSSRGYPFDSPFNQLVSDALNEMVGGYLNGQGPARKLLEIANFGAAEGRIAWPFMERLIDTDPRTFSWVLGNATLSEEQVEKILTAFFALPLDPDMIDGLGGFLERSESSINRDWLFACWTQEMIAALGDGIEVPKRLPLLRGELLRIERIAPQLTDGNTLGLLRKHQVKIGNAFPECANLLHRVIVKLTDYYHQSRSAGRPE